MNILLVDDHRLFAGSLKNLLEAGGMTVAGIAANGVEALEMALELRPDLILMDIGMTGCDGLTATRLIKNELPDMKIIMLTMNDDDESLFAAVRNGASGYLLKNLDADDFFACLERAAAGEAVFSPGLAERVLKEFMKSQGGRGGALKPGPPAILTSRQEEVLLLVAAGKTYKQVAATLAITETTVKYHMN